MKYIISLISALGLLACWGGAAVNTHWVGVYSIAVLKKENPLDWGFVFIFSLGLIVAGGIAVAAASLITAATNTNLPAAFSPRSTWRLFGYGVALFALSLVVQYATAYFFHK